MIFHLYLKLDVDATPQGTDLFEATDRFMEELHALANQADHLDCTVGVERAPSSRSAGTIEVDLDVEARTFDDAVPLAMSWLRAALHASDVPTPRWGPDAITVTRQSVVTCS